MRKASLISAPIPTFIKTLRSKPEGFGMFDVSDGVFSNKLVWAVNFDNSFYNVIPFQFRTGTVKNAYLAGKLMTQSVQGGSISRSYEGYPVLLFPTEASVECIDRVVDVPVLYTTSIVTRVNIVDAEAFAKGLDVELSNLSMQYAIEFFSGLIVNAANAAVTELIVEDGVTYFTIATKYKDIAESIADAVDFSSYGISVSYCAVQNVSIPEDVRKVISDGYMAIRTEKIKDELQQKEDEAALCQYEQKARIYKETGYPGTMTETDKDRALERYLKRMKECPKTNTVVRVIEKTVPCAGMQYAPVAPVAAPAEQAETVQEEAAEQSPILVPTGLAEVPGEEDTFVTAEGDEQIVAPAVAEAPIVLVGEDADELPKKKTVWLGIIISILIGAAAGYILYQFLTPQWWGWVIGGVIAIIGILITIAIVRAYNVNHGFAVPGNVSSARELRSYLDSDVETAQFVSRNGKGRTVISF